MAGVYEKGVREIEAGSGKREAGSGKREAGSGKREAGSGAFLDKCNFPLDSGELSG